METWLEIGINAFWCGFAALGFAVLFNAPPRALFPVWIGGFLAGLVKYGFLLSAVEAGAIISSFLGAVTVGIASIPIAHISHIPPMIFSIPSVIPLIPGVFAYRAMLGLIRLTGNIGFGYEEVLSETIHNGVIALFIMMALSLGVAVPMHVMRKESVKNIRMKSLVRKINTLTRMKS